MATWAKFDILFTLTGWEGSSEEAEKASISAGKTKIERTEEFQEVELMDALEYFARESCIVEQIFTCKWLGRWGDLFRARWFGHMYITNRITSLQSCPPTTRIAESEAGIFCVKNHIIQQKHYCVRDYYSPMFQSKACTREFVFLKSRHQFTSLPIWSNPILACGCHGR